MRLLKPLAGAAMACLLLSAAGCTTLVPNPVKETTVFQIANTYGVIQTAAVAYSALPRCAAGTHASATNVCATQAIIKQLYAADQKARIALTAAENFSRNPNNYPGLSFSTLVATAQAAVTALSQIEAVNGVN